MSTVAPTIASASDRVAAVPPLISSRDPVEGSSQRLAFFDVMRHFLALYVVLGHTVMLVPGSGFPFQIKPVAAFLSISGFLVLQSYQYSRSWWHFAWKRILRVYPALICSLLFVWILLGWPACADTISMYITGGIGPQVPWNHYIHWHKAQYNGVVWSLAWEELAYLGLAVLWALGAYRRPWAVALLCIASIVFSLLVPAPAKTTIAPAALFPCFFLGNLYYLCLEKKWLTRPSFWTGLAIFAVVMTIVQFPFVHSTNDTVRSALSGVAVLALGSARIRDFKMPDFSYSIYIYHSPITFVVAACYGGFWFTLGWTLAFLIPMCALSWRYIEKPALGYKDYFWKKKGANPALPPA